MKKFLITSTSFFSILFLPVSLLKIRKKLIHCCLLVFMVLSSGCYLNYYKTNTLNHLDQATLMSLKNKNKIFILYLNEGIYAVNNITFKDNTFEGDKYPLPENHFRYLHPAANSSPRYKKIYGNLLSEVHIYATDVKGDSSQHITFPTHSISRVDIYEKDQSKTTTNHIFSTVGMVAGGVILAAVISAATAVKPTQDNTNQGCNCPQVYTYDNGKYNFKSGVFSGAVYSSLEKTDFLPLENLTDDNGKYKFKLMNNQQEEQFVNQLQLIKVDHDPATKVLLDRHGNMYQYGTLQSPKLTSLPNSEETLLKARDGMAYSFNLKADRSSKFASIILSFDRPVNATKAKLVVNAKNSMWAGYMYEEFSSLFGNKFQQYTAMQDKADKQKIERWQQDQALPMMAYIETEKGWQPIDYFSITGNTAGRDMIMPVILPVDNKNIFRIKLESAFMFWELDYAGIDFSEDVKLKQEIINLSNALKSGAEKTEVFNLKEKDNNYTKLLEKEFITAEFNKPLQAGNMVSSYFLSSTGYYHSLKTYSGTANKLKLNHFKKRGAFNDFSEYEFSETQKMLAKVNLFTRESAN